MKSFLIKVGKAWNVLQRDGVWNGTQRIAVAFFGLFQRVTPGDILFITNGVGDSARYRTTNVAEELRLYNFTVSITVQDNPFLLSYVDKFSVFVFHRTLFTEKVKKFVETLKTKKKEIIFEADDLVYDPAFLVHMDYYRNLNALERPLFEHGLGGEILTDPYVKTATTTTKFLAEKLREKGKNVFVVPNRLSREDVEWAEGLPLEEKGSEKVTLGYMSGTASHDKDFSILTETLKRFFDRFPKLSLVIVGPLILDPALDPWKERIEHVSYMPRHSLFEFLNERIDINVAPLEIGNPFCESKSELKFFEAGLVGVPTVASATGTFKQAITEGVDGFVATSSSEWEDKLTKLIEDEKLRKTIGEKARETAKAKYTTDKADNTDYYNYLKGKV